MHTSGHNPNLLVGETAACFLGKVGGFGRGKSSSSAELAQLGWIWPQLNDHTQYSTSRAQVVGAQQGQCENILFVKATQAPKPETKTLLTGSYVNFWSMFSTEIWVLQLIRQYIGFLCCTILVCKPNKMCVYCLGFV